MPLFELLLAVAFVEIELDNNEWVMVFGGAEDAKANYALPLLLVDCDLFYTVEFDSAIARYGIMYCCSTTKR